MARSARTYIGVRDGRPFKMMHAPLSHVLSVELRSFVWHLWIEGEYRGNFPTKTAALAFMDSARAEIEQVQA
jgi:hypothetical protein